MITHEQLMRYLDGELAPDEARQVEAAMETSTELRREYLLFSRMKADLRSLGEHMSPSSTVWSPVSRAIARPIGWLLFLVGSVVWLGYAVYMYLASPEAMWEKLATGAVVVGLAMLLLSALLDRLRDLKSDPYREIHK
jgi:anti-sigma factor RsiW